MPCEKAKIATVRKWDGERSEREEKERESACVYVRE